MKIYENKNLNEMKKIVSTYTKQTSDPEIERAVDDILKDVRVSQDDALRKYSEKFDGVKINDFRVPKEALNKAYDSIDDKLKNAMELAKKNIVSFHKLEIEKGFVDLSTKGIMRGQKVTPLESVGLYVPGGRAAYPSTILMSALPAKIAGVKKVVMVTPPQKDGISTAVLAAAKLAGVDEVYQVGGAQAVAALAFGTQSIPKVDKIIRPGNIFVAVAKKKVFGTVAIDMVAGPSEIGILADDSANAETDCGRSAVASRTRSACACNDDYRFEKVGRRRLKRSRDSIADASERKNRSPINRRQGFIAVMDDKEEMFDLMNEVAPEHLEVNLENPHPVSSFDKKCRVRLLGQIRFRAFGRLRSRTKPRFADWRDCTLFFSARRL